MAKTTSSTKAKTKTPKRVSAAKSTAKTSRTVKKPAASKPAVKESTKKANTTKGAKVTTKVAEVTAVPPKTRRERKARIVTVERLRSLNLIVAGLTLLAAVAAAYFMKSDSWQITTGHATADAIRSATSTVFAPAQTALFDLQLRWMLAATLIAASALALLRATRLKAREARDVDAKVMPLRWTELAITGALMVEIVALLSGMHDLVSLKLLAGLTVVSAVLAWLAERANSVGRPSKAQFVTSGIAGALPLLAVGAYLLGTWVYGLVRMPWYVYAAFAVLVVGSVLLAVNEYKLLKGRFTNYLIVERNYALIGLVTKLAFAAVLIVGLARSL